MNEAGIKDAIREAERFVKAARAALHDNRPITVDRAKFFLINTGKASGACRRASMDLTRALAEMRKP